MRPALLPGTLDRLTDDAVTLGLAIGFQYRIKQEVLRPSVSCTSAVSNQT